jgi:hypothetical protein
MRRSEGGCNRRWPHDPVWDQTQVDVDGKFVRSDFGAFCKATGKELFDLTEEVGMSNFTLK